MSDAPVVIVGLGQMGGTFAHGLLRCGRTVVPVTRDRDPARVAADVPAPALVLVAVGEAELPAALETVPAPWRDRVALIQNELLPEDWEAHGIAAPTVAVVWFEKKKDKPLTAIRPTAIAGPRADVLRAALEAIELPVARVDDERLLFELVTKNLYILTTNIAGLEVGGTVGALWAEHRALAEAVAREVLAIEAWRAGTELPSDALLDAMVAAFEADPSHGCRGRSAPDRLRRALRRAKSADLATPTLERIAKLGIGS